MPFYLPPSPCTALYPSAPLLIGNVFELQVTEITTVAQTNKDLFFFHLQIYLKMNVCWHWLSTWAEKVGLTILLALCNGDRIATAARILAALRGRKQLSMQGRRVLCTCCPLNRRTCSECHHPHGRRTLVSLLSNVSDSTSPLPHPMKGG